MQGKVFSVLYVIQRELAPLSGVNDRRIQIIMRLFPRFFTFGSEWRMWCKANPHRKRSPSFIKEAFSLDKGDTAKPRGFESLEKTDLFKIGSFLYYVIN